MPAAFTTMSAQHDSIQGCPCSQPFLTRWHGSALTCISPTLIVPLITSCHQNYLARLNLGCEYACASLDGSFRGSC